MLHHLFQRQEGQGLVEYSLMLLLMAIVMIITLTALGLQVSDLYNSVVTSWPT